MKLKTKVLIGFVSALLMIIISGYLSYRSAEDTVKDNLARRDINNFIKQIIQLSSDYYQSESAESYYVLTNEDKYLNELEFYDTKLQKEIIDLNNNKNSVLKQEELIKMFDNLDAIMRNEISGDKEKIEVFKQKDPAASKKIYDVTENDLSRTKLNNSINELVIRLEQSRFEVNNKAVEEANFTRIAIPGGSFLALLILFTAFILMNRDITAREKAEKELKQLNENLEGLVSERTNNLKVLNNELQKEIEFRKDAEKKVNQLNRIYLVLSNINQAIVRISDKKKLLDESCRIIVEDGKTRMAWVGFVDEETSKIFPYSKFGFDNGYLDRIDISVLDIPSGRGPVGSCFREDKYIFINNIKNDPRMNPWKEAALERGYNSACSFPLKVNSKVVGVFTIYAAETDFYTNDEIKLMEELTGDISFALETIELEHRNKIAEDKLKISEGRYRGLFENMVEGYALCHMLYENGLPVDWIYIAVNKPFERLTGLKGVAGKRVSQVIPNIQAADPKLFEIYSRVSLTGKPERFEMFVEALKMWFSISVYSPGKEYFVAVFDVITDRKFAEKALRESEQRLRRFYESGLLGVIYWNMDGKITDANDKFLDMVGYSRDDLVRGEIEWTKMTPPEFRELDEISTRELKAEGVNKMPFEKEYIRKDGTRVPIIIAGAMTDEERFNGVAFVLDNSERKQSEEALRESEYKFITAFNSSPVAMALTSLVDKKYVIVNDIFLRDSGYSRDEVIGKTSEELKIFFNDGDRDKLITNVLKNGFVYGMEANIRTKSGKIIICLLYSTLIKLSGAPYLISSIVDITQRKEDEAKLQLSETKLSNAMKIAQLGHWEYDVVNDQFTFNDQFYDIFKTTAEKEFGYTMSSSEYARRFVHPDDMQLVGIEIKKAIETTEPDYSGQIEHRIIYADGEMGYISVRFFIIKDSSGKTIKTIGANQDITERKRAEEKLLEQNILMKTLIDSSPDLIYIKDDKSRFRMASNSVAEFMGTNPDTLIGKSDFDFYPNELAQQFYNDEKEILVSGRALFNVEEPRINNDGSKTWILTTKVPLYNSLGAITGLLGISRDITARKFAEEKLRKSEQLQHLHVENTPLGVIEWDLNFCVANWNHSAEKIFGFSREEAMGKHSSLIVPDEAKQLIDKAWIELKNNRGGFRSTNNNVNKNGDTIICSWYNTPLLDNDGKVHGVASLVDDVTQIVKQENKLKEALNEKELLLKEIHHRVKNNLQIVTSLLNMQSGLVEDERIKDFFKISSDRVRAMALIHQQLYKSVDITYINFEFYLKDLVSHLFKLYCTKPDKIRTNIQAPGITMNIDNAVPCGLLVNEIITNSFKHAFPGDRAGEIKIDMKIKDENYVLKISDNGVGMCENIDIEEKKGLGSELITMLSEQLDAIMEIKKKKGLEYIFTFKALSYKKRV